MALRTPPTPPLSILQPVLAQQCYYLSCYVHTAQVQVVQTQSIKECLKGITKLPNKGLALFTFKRSIHISLVKAYKVTNNVVTRTDNLCSPFLIIEGHEDTRLNKSEGSF